MNKVKFLGALTVAVLCTVLILQNTQSMGQANKAGSARKGFVQDIEGLTIKNDDFRRVLYTAKHCQLVVMALKPRKR